MTLEELCRELFHALDEPVELWRDGELVARNPAAEGLAFRDDKARTRALAGEPVRVAGGSGWLDLRAFPVGDHVAICFRDVTARVRAEQDHQEMTRLRDRGQRFLQGLAHDLHAPLRTMGMYAQLLERQELPEQAGKPLQTILAGVERMQRLVDDVLAYGEVSLAHLEVAPVDLHLLTEQIVAQLDAPDAHIRWEDLPTVQGSAPLLREALLRLLDNATRYRGPGELDVRLTAEQLDAHWCVSVQDTGEGMDARFEEEVFQPFKRLHGYEDHPGSGLGLAIVREVAERHGGHVHARSTPGAGSCFQLFLPVSP